MTTHRYERKFITSALSYQEIETLIKLHPAMFHRTFNARFVNNLYFDSIDLKNYFDNIDGTSARRKIRIRWYGQLFGLIREPTLEIKEKQEVVGKKQSYPLIPFSLDKNFKLKTILSSIKRSPLPESIKLELTSLEVTLLNHYKRNYFQSSNRNYRITLDSGLMFIQVNKHSNTFVNLSHNSRAIIIELKYDSELDPYINNFGHLFPFRATKNSKYVSGIENLLQW